MEQKISIALPSSWTDRDVTIDFDTLRPDVVFQCLLIGLRTRVFDSLTELPRNGRTEGRWVAEAITKTFASLQQPTESDSDDLVIIEVPRYVEASAIYDVSNSVEPLDLLSVPVITRQNLIFDGIHCFPAKDLPERLLADILILPGDEGDEADEREVD